MARPKVELKFKGALLKFKSGQIMDRQTKDQLGSTVVSMMLEFISKGQSPVKGYGRFPGYAADRKAAGAGADLDKKSQRKLRSSIRGSSRFYPNSILHKFPNKKRRPVNLSLNGRFLSTIKHSPLLNGTEVGHLDPTQRIGKNATVKDLWETHNEGRHRHVPQRKYLPGSGEKFAISIMRKIRDIISQRISRLIQESK